MSRGRYVLSGLLAASLSLLAAVAGVSLIVAIRNDSARYLALAGISAVFALVVGVSKAYVDRDSFLG